MRMHSNSWIKPWWVSKGPKKSLSLQKHSLAALSSWSSPLERSRQSANLNVGSKKQHTRVKQSGRRKHLRHIAVVSEDAHQTSRCAGSSCRRPVAPADRWGSGSAFCPGASPSCSSSRLAGRAAAPPAGGIGCRQGRWWSLPTFHPREIPFILDIFLSPVIQL